MVESPQSAAKLQLDRLHRRTRIVRHPNASLSKITKSPIMTLDAEARILEEPGAVILHAGICEGAAGQLAILP
jgi:hypothetical protein